MRKFSVFSLILTACIAFSLIVPFLGHSAQAETSSAETAMELSTQTVLYESGADVRLPMASTTKIMTALLIAEDCNLDEVITVPDLAVGVEGSSIYLKKNEQIDVRDLLYGLMLRSGNDSAVALAIIHSGSIESFVERMNARAKELDAENTNFTNPSGLPDENHYTTARDLCKIACAAMNNEIFRQVVGTKSWKGRFRSYSNKNKMLYNYDGATGIKTGYTLKAGRCLVSSALREGMEVVCVVLNVYDMYNRSAEILDSCFNKYELVKLSKNKLFMCDKVLCKIDKDCDFVVKKDCPIQLKTIAYKNFAERDKNDGAKGKIEIYQEKSLIFRRNLYSIV